MSAANYSQGDWVIYAKQKVSASPGKRAQEVSPAAKGDTYSYVVEKFWVVDEATSDGKLRLKTRRGKEHVVDVDDPLLRRPKWWEKLWYGNRFRPAANGSSEGG